MPESNSRLTLLITIAIGIIAVGCASMRLMQTDRTLPPPASTGLIVRQNAAAGTISVFSSGSMPAQATYTLTAKTELTGITGVRLEVLPDDGLRLARGFLLERLDRVPEAVAELRKVAERRPNDPMTLNALGYTLVDRTKAVAEGTELIERAITAKPDSYAIQDSMGWALVQSGRLEDGKTWLQKAWDLSEDPEVAAHLGETLWRMGRPDEAKQLWNDALAANPDSPPLKAAIERRAQ